MSAPLILASASPRRLELLRSVGVEPEVRPSRADETARPDEAPPELVLRLAEAKARWVVERGVPPDALVLGSDTAVVLGRRILGKPRDDAEAREMLRALRGRAHDVWSGVYVAAHEGSVGAGDACATRVTFRAFDEAELAAYVETGEPRDKAGAYGIQGAGGALVERIEGSYSNVVGLPLERLAALFERVGVRPRGFEAPAG